MSKIYQISEKLLEELNQSVPKHEIFGRLILVNDGSFQVSGAKEKSNSRSMNSVLRHPQMPEIIYELITNRLKAKQEVATYMTNFCTDGSFYWMFANLKPMFDSMGTYSVIQTKPSENAMKIIPNLFRILLICENNGGIESSKKMLDNLLNEHHMDYNDFVQFLQR